MFNTYIDLNKRSLELPSFELALFDLLSFEQKLRHLRWRVEEIGGKNQKYSSDVFWQQNTLLETKLLLRWKQQRANTIAKTGKIKAQTKRACEVFNFAFSCFEVRYRLSLNYWITKSDSSMIYLTKETFMHRPFSFIPFGYFVYSMRKILLINIYFCATENNR